MAENVRRIAVVGGRTPLGRRVVAALRASEAVADVRGIESTPSHDPSGAPDVDVVPYLPDHRPFAAYLVENAIDTVIHCSLVADRAGRGPRRRSADVIATMCLGNAIASEGVAVRSWVVASSSDVYPVDSHSPRLRREEVDLFHEPDSHDASIAEAEDYARDVAVRLPHVNVALLRLQQIAGGGANGALASVLARRVVPSPVGFDPLVQLLHVDDAASALTFAAVEELPGLYNVASAGAIHWSDAVRATGRATLPVVPVGASLLEPLLERVGVPFLPSDTVDLARFGQALDTAKIERVGWHAQYDQDGCIAALNEPEGQPATGAPPRRAQSPPAARRRA